MRQRGVPRHENPSKPTLRRRYYVIKLLTSGQCLRCCGPRRADGTESYCRTCANKLKGENEARYRSRVESGLCRQCESPRGPLGTTVYCRPCADRVNENARARKIGASDGSA